MTSGAHRIRLRGPWLLKLPGSEPIGVRFDWPPDWSQLAPASPSQPAALLRSFQRPPGLREDRVFVVVESRGGEGRLQLNGQPLGAWQAPVARFDVTSLLQVRNQLQLDVQAGRDEISEVRLEIEPQ